MPKAEAHGWFYLVVIVLAISGFVWLHEQIGTFGIVALVVLLVAGAILKSVQKTKSIQAAYDDLVLYILRNRLSVEESRQVYNSARKLDPSRMSLLRNIQILSESVYLATTSKKRDTAESRMDLALERYAEVSGKQANLVSSHVREQIDAFVRQAQQEFGTQMYLNVVQGHIEKAEKLKTAKSKLKYLGMAAEVIQEGLDEGKGDRDALKSALDSVEGKLKRIQNGNT